MPLASYGNKEEMKESKKSALHMVCVFADVGWSSYILSFLPCYCTFSGPSLIEIKFNINFFPSLNINWTVLTCVRCSLAPISLNGNCASDGYIAHLDNM